MAQRGFPWHSRAAENADQITSAEPQFGLLRAQSDPEKRLSDLKNRARAVGMADDQLRGQPTGKRRAVSLATSPSTRPFIKLSVEKPVPKHAVSPSPQIRTIPPWVVSAEEDDLEPESPISNPSTAFVAQHHYSQSASRNPLPSFNAHQGPTTSFGAVRPERTSRWVSFAKSSAYPRETFNSEKVDAEWLDQNFGDYSQPWLANHTDDDTEEGSGVYHAFRKKRKVWYKRSQFTLLRNPFIPLLFRLINLTFALIALALGTTIWRKSAMTKTPGYQPGPSAEMAIIVDAIAVVYILYITYDEYFSKPLGLRSARAKVRLVLLDLFFIVFQASNLSLGFESIGLESGACKAGHEKGTDFSFPDICSRAEALASVLLISLIAWLLTFTVSVFRLVERIDQG